MAEDTVATPDVTVLDPAAFVIALSEGAQAKARHFLAQEGPGKALRVGVDSGGCSGFSYKVEVDEKRDGDRVQPYEGFEVVVAKKVVPLIADMTVDYKDTIGEAGFVFQNPQATGTCGCGVSFDV